MDNSVVIELAATYGWAWISSNNKYMISFEKYNDYDERVRLNLYSTGTVQIQRGTERAGGRVEKDVDMLGLEKLFMEY